MNDSQAKTIMLGAVNKMLPNFQYYRRQASRTCKPWWEEDGQWYHTDETWTDKIGPFPTKEAAQEALRAYANKLTALALGLEHD